MLNKLFGHKAAKMGCQIELRPVFRTGLILNGLGLCKGLVPILHRGQALELFL